MAYRWNTPAAGWLEDETSGRFLPEAACATPAMRARAGDIAALLGGVRPRGCACAPVYPDGFAFCPHCGEALERGGAAPRDWFGAAGDPFLPRHVPQGLSVTSLPLAAALEARAGPARPDLTLPAPPNAGSVYLSGHFGYPVPRLLALAPARGVVQYWDPSLCAWQILLGAAADCDLSFSRSAYAWLPAWNPDPGEAGIVPAADGLWRLHVDLVAETWSARRVLAAPLASAPGALAQACACIADGGRTLWTAASDWSEAETHPLDVPEAGWSRPFAWEGRLAWLHCAGMLSWRPGAAPVWNPWPAGWTPSLGLAGPTPSRDGRQWLLGHDAGGYAFVDLGDPAAAPRHVDGARPGCAGFLFRRGHEVKGDPWEREHVEDQDADAALVLPLLRVWHADRAQAGGLALRLHRYLGRAEEALDGRVIARASFEWIGRTNAVLDEIARLRRPQDCGVFVHDAHLWLHHPDWNVLRGWRVGALA
ncbi:MAG TPA: hypothetical protein VFF16_07510 [Telluria sp.]|nr:hypothetical protein [Telluria sp.]